MVRTMEETKVLHEWWKFCITFQRTKDLISLIEESNFTQPYVSRYETPRSKKFKNKLRKDFYFVTEKLGFKRFCADLVEHNRMQVVNRRMAEAAWLDLLLKKYSEWNHCCLTAEYGEGKELWNKGRLLEEALDKIYGSDVTEFWAKLVTKYYPKNQVDISTPRTVKTLRHQFAKSEDDKSDSNLDEKSDSDNVDDENTDGKVQTTRIARKSAGYEFNNDAYVSHDSDSESESNKKAPKTRTLQLRLKEARNKSKQIRDRFEQENKSAQRR